MPSFRKPWPMSRTRTDDVTLNTLGGDGKTAGHGVTEVPAHEHGESSSGSHGGESPGEAAEDDLKQFRTLHKWDPNLEHEKRDAIDAAINKHDHALESAIDGEIHETSPYPEVASAVRNTDDPDMPANTVRAWVLGLLFTTIGAGLNMLFSLRNPQITITSIVAQLISYPIGCFCARVLPTRKFRTFGQEWTLNPGPFNLKEHTLITVMANVSFGNGVAYSTDTIQALLGFYKINKGWGYDLLFTLSTQIIGFGLAGTFRRFLVWPAAMIWPGILPNAALFYALHDHTPPDPAKTHGWSISRYRWFLYVMIGSFVWYWIPGFLWQGLSVFVFVTWIKPNNVVVNQLFGGFTGLGLIPLSFDWTYISAYVLSPLIPPWHAIGNTLIGVLFIYIIGASATHFSGAFYAEYLPMSDSSSYDNMAQVYNVSRIITPEFTLDPQAYAEYSPLFLSTTFAISYGVSFATIVAVVVHTALYHWRDLWYRAKAARTQEDDIHMRLMKRYPEAPDWWYYIVFAVMFGVGMGTVVGYDTGLTWWAFIIALLISITWTAPIGMIQAITNIQLGLNVFTEFIIGYMLPGRPLAMMEFKTFGYITMTQGLLYTQDLKLGHYMKVPPRALFWGQGVATFWSCFVQIAVLRWAFGAIDNICDADQSGRFSCPNGRVFFNASVIWGLIGPARIFSNGAIYSNLQFFWIVGAILPVIFFFLARAFPKSPARYLNAPVMLGATGFIPPATPLIYLCWGIVGFIFNKWIRSSKKGWWMVYNYVTSAALDSGLAISTIIIFFALLLPQVDPPSWWGNNVVGTTMDAMGTAVQKTLGEGETFGPAVWH